MGKFWIVLLLSCIVGISVIVSGGLSRSLPGSIGQPSLAAQNSGLDPATCSFSGKPLYGKVQIVTSFPDIKVQVVESFPDLKVKPVTAFPDDCGEWQLVESFPDIKVQFVQSFPDLKIQYVEAFPGLASL